MELPEDIGITCCFDDGFISSEQGAMCVEGDTLSLLERMSQHCKKSDLSEFSLSHFVQYIVEQEPVPTMPFWSVIAYRVLDLVRDGSAGATSVRNLKRLRLRGGRLRKVKPDGFRGNWVFFPTINRKTLEWCQCDL